MRYLVDTNHLGRASQEGSSLGDRIVVAHAAGHRFGTIVPVIGETQVGLEAVSELSRGEV